MRSTIALKRFGMGRLIRAPIKHRRSRALLTISALIVGATLIAALFTLYRGVQSNLGNEFRRYGANLIVTPPAGSTVIPREQSEAALATLRTATEGVGVLYTIAEVSGTPVYLAGAELDRLVRLNSSWKVVGPLPRENEAWVGVGAERALRLKPGSFIEVVVDGQTRRWRVAGTIQSGSSEDNQILAPLAQVEAITGLKGYTTLQVRTAADRVEATAAALRQLLPGAQVSPVRQIATSEGRVILSTRTMLLAATALIVFTVGLCLIASLTTLALERRQDFGLMKALGGSEKTIMLAFIGEASLLGGAATIVGFGLGTAAAGAIGWQLFGVWLLPSASAAVWTASVTMTLALLASLSPWPIVRTAMPATILRGQ